MRLTKGEVLVVFQRGKSVRNKVKFVSLMNSATIYIQRKKKRENGQILMTMEAM